MSLNKTITPATAPNTAYMRETANPQLSSTLFGRLPLEIRDMIYVECWRASGLRQHVFLRDGRLTHWPCTLVSDERDERLEELHRMIEVQGTQPRSRTRSLVLHGKWARRFSSPWHNHWRCEEEMEGSMADDEGTRSGTLFLSILLTCKRTYLESRPSLYASLTPILTDLSSAHALLALSPATISSRLHSLSLSLALPVATLHQHRLRTHTTDAPDAWAGLCTALSNLARFDALRDVAVRLAVAVDDRDPGADEAGRMVGLPGGRGDAPAWPDVRERWALAAVRGVLARRLTLWLPRVAPTYTYPEWMRTYLYLDEEEEEEDNEDGGGSGRGRGPGRGVPFRRLERYEALPPMRRRGDGRVEPRMDGPRGVGSGTGYGRGEGDRGKEKEKEVGGTRLQRTRRSVRRLVGGLRLS
ncbi:hypothetical protein F5B19DRAFT_492647 [Rostrohypoxylon terebratum]|nr:hypothetical protein F5B19DRAFT_492647 [Rostrohypoxylon terebratum]